MILTPRVLAKLAVIILAAAILQLTFFSKISLATVSPDLLAALTIGFGLLGGALIGAVCGFIAGLLVDSMLISTLGVTSLALITAGYLAGRFRESFVMHSSLVPYLVTGALTTVAAAVFAVLQIMVGTGAQISPLILREVILKGVLGVLLSVPLYSLIRRILGPALIDYEPPGHRPLLSGFTRGASRTSRHRKTGRMLRGAGLRRTKESPPRGAPGAIIRSARTD